LYLSEQKSAPAALLQQINAARPAHQAAPLPHGASWAAALAAAGHPCLALDLAVYLASQWPQRLAGPLSDRWAQRRALPSAALSSPTTSPALSPQPLSWMAAGLGHAPRRRPALVVHLAGAGRAARHNPSRRIPLNDPRYGEQILSERSIQIPQTGLGGVASPIY